MEVSLRGVESATRRCYLSLEGSLDATQLQQQHVLLVRHEATQQILFQESLTDYHVLLVDECDVWVGRRKPHSRLELQFVSIEFVNEVLQILFAFLPVPLADRYLEQKPRWSVGPGLTLVSFDPRSPETETKEMLEATSSNEYGTETEEELEVTDSVSSFPSERVETPPVPCDSPPSASAELLRHFDFPTPTTVVCTHTCVQPFAPSYNEISTAPCPPPKESLYRLSDQLQVTPSTTTTPTTAHALTASISVTALEDESKYEEETSGVSVADRIRMFGVRARRDQMPRSPANDRKSSTENTDKKSLNKQSFHKSLYNLSYTAFEHL